MAAVSDMTLREVAAAASGRRPLWGAFVSSNSPHMAEVMGRAGFDWLVVDLQHAPTSGSDRLALMIAAAGIAGTPVIVRLPWKTDYASAMWALDAGADGILAPMVDSAAEAAAISRACRYPPRGFRSFGPWRLAQQYPSYDTEIGDRRALCLVQIETRGGMDDLEAILAVDELDGVYIGPQDLSISHGGGMSWRTDNAVLHGLSERVVAACRAAGKISVAHTADPTDARHWASIGFDFVTATSDLRLLSEGVREALGVLHADGQSDVDVPGSAVGAAAGAVAQEASP